MPPRRGGSPNRIRISLDFKLVTTARCRRCLFSALFCMSTMLRRPNYVNDRATRVPSPPRPAPRSTCYRCFTTAAVYRWWRGRESEKRKLNEKSRTFKSTPTIRLHDECKSNLMPILYLYFASAHQPVLRFLPPPSPLLGLDFTAFRAIRYIEFSKV